MINYDTLFDDENKDLLAKLEAESAGILGRLEGRSGDGTSALDKIRANKEYRSPFMDANNVPVGENVLTDKATSIFAFTGLDQNENACYEYFVSAIPFDDGAKVYAAYESAAIEPHQLHLFYENETDKKNNLFGNFYIAKIGNSFSDNIIKKFQTPNFKISALINQQQVNPIQDSDGLTSYVQRATYSLNCDIIDFDTTYNAIAREYNSKTVLGKFIVGVNSIDEKIAKGLEWCADELELVLIKEKSYIPSDDYTPIIKQSRDKLGPENLVANLFEEAANSPFAKEVEAAIVEAYGYIRKTLENLGKFLYRQMPEPIKNIIRKLHQLVQQLKTGLDTILQSVGDFINAVGSLVVEVLQLINAFLCGIINGIISTVQVIIRIVAFLIDMKGMDADYKSYLRRRDVGEKIESVFDFITESISSIVNGIISLFTQPTETTAEDIKRFLQSIGNLIENVGGKIGDFFENTSRFKYAYYAGYGFFEVCINVLLLFLTGGLGNIAKAITGSEKVIATLKIFGKEAFSVATFGVVDILKLFRSLIGAFVRACSKGLKGFLRWIEALIQEIKSGKKGKSMEELLEDAERTVDDLDELFEISQIDKAIEELGITIKVPKNALNAVESAKKLELVTAKLKKAIPPKIFDPNKAALKKLGIKLPASKAGLSVDFSNTDYLYKAKIGEKSIVKIKLTGHDDADVLLSSKLAGLTNKPKNYTWHHLDDYNPLNGTCSMQLVETSIHIKCNPHVGGVKVLEDFLSFKYLTRLN